MNVIVSILGREAIPVRAVPYLSGWVGMTHDALVDALVGDEHFYQFNGLRAYKQQGQDIKPFFTRDWYNIATQLGAADDRVQAREVTHRDGVAQFRQECLRLMPAGVFVWRDEFEPMYRRKYLSNKPHFDSAEAQIPHEERAEHVALDFDPHISDDELRLAMEGFNTPTIAAAMVAPVTEPGAAVGLPDASVGEVSHWKMRIQIEAAAHMKRLSAANASPTVHSIIGDMARWCRTNEVKTDSGIFPSANYLRTHVLGGNNWTPPR